MKIKNYLKNKLPKLPGAIVFSKSFLSFTKEKNIAETFLNRARENESLKKVFYILEKDDNLDYSLSTHADIEELSYFNEKEVLFFPFSSFEIKDININEKLIENEKIYEIKLLYLWKYIKEIKKDLNEKGNKIVPNSEFKKELIDYGLINSEIISKSNNIKKIIKRYEEYKEEIIKYKKENNNLKNIIKKLKLNENIKNEEINKNKQINKINEINNENINKNNENKKLFKK